MAKNNRETGVTRLLEIMARLRDPERGCPWDRAQTWQSLIPFTLEESYEVADAIERGAVDGVREELGDLLFQVVFYAQIAAEQGQFDFEEVVSGIAAKLERRHPHVFGETRIGSAAEQTLAWEEHKARERAALGAVAGAAAALAGVAQALPALTRAVKLQQRAARVGFDWPEVGDVLAKVDEELAEVRAELDAGIPSPEALEHEVGDLLLAVSNLARHLCIDPETALRRANRRFEGRFRHMEQALAAQGRDLLDTRPEELDELWIQAKAAER
jgi:MazG family protein